MAEGCAIAILSHIHIHTNSFCRSSVGQTTSGYETCQDKKNIYSIR